MTGFYPTSMSSAQVRAFTLSAEEAEDLDGFGVGAAEPVWHAGVELSRFAGGEHEILVAEHQSEPPAQDVNPFVAFMGLRLGDDRLADAGNDQLVCLHATGAAGQRHQGHAVAADRA